LDDNIPTPKRPAREIEGGSEFLAFNIDRNLRGNDIDLAEARQFDGRLRAKSRASDIDC
jgi:hypothetical protein